MNPLMTISAEPISPHLKRLTEKYPFGLLGDDHGILNDDDLALNTCDVVVGPVTSGNGAYPYWQCFRTKEASFECDDSGYDPDEKSQMAIMAIAIRTDHRSDEYLSRRAIPMADCRDYRKDWLRLTGSQEFFCASGLLIKYQKPNISGVIESSWIFDRFKTAKGCDPYFKGGCSLKYRLKHGCTLPKK